MLLRLVPAALAWGVSTAYVALYLNRGWIGHDDGALAQMAERVLAGELPHRDFDDIYTGGLDYLHALSFVLFGHELTSMRLVLFAFFLAWVPALYVVARRFVSPLAAAGVVLLCVVWSLPNYTASMPSWYNLFLATFAAVALFRYLDSRQARYLVLAGLACGVSAAIKITGVYALAALVLALLLLEQHEGPTRPARRRWSAYSVALAACMTVFVSGLVVVVHRRLSAPDLVDFVAPGAALCGFLVWNELREARDGARVRFARAGRMLAPLLAGAAAPIAVLALPYLVSGSVGELVAGVLLEPGARLEFASAPPPRLDSLDDVVLPGVAIAAIALLTPHRLRYAGAVVVALALVGWLATLESGWAMHAVWMSVRWAARLFLPLAALALAVGGSRAGRGSAPIQFFALLALAAWTALIQFPFAGEIYFAYAAPLFFLAVAAFGRWRSANGGNAISPALALPVLAILIAFGVFGMNLNGWSAENHPFNLSRAGSLRVDAWSPTVYPRIVALVQQHAAGDAIYAGPDSPEVYFLSGKDNPTPYVFDFLEAEPVRDETLRRVIDDPRITVAVLNTRPAFSPAHGGAMLRIFERRFPHHERVDRFDVRWSS